MSDPAARVPSSSMTTEVTKASRNKSSCDSCKRKKVKCDSAKFPDRQCTNCRSHNVPCTHETAKQRSGFKQFSQHVAGLNERIQELEELLRQSQQTQWVMNSGGDPLRELRIHRGGHSLISETKDPVAHITAAHEHAPTADLEQTDPEYIKMVSDMRKFSLSDVAFQERFFGPSSNMYFMRQMMGMHGGTIVPVTNRSMHRSPHPWEEETLKPPTLVFPEEDLLHTLVDLFFSSIPSYFRPLHEPSFRRDVLSGLHHVQPSFGAVVLLVCANASRYSSDPRVLMEGDKTTHSAGWKWTSQTLPNFHLFNWPSLYDVQYCCLLAEYMLGTANIQSVWPIVGLGMRYAIELGLHRRRDEKVTAQSELRKRVFWTIYMLDRGLSMYQGRPSAIPDDEMDTEYPVLCDDEFWDTGDPATDFKQPAGVPSKIEGFIWMIKLYQIVSFALRSVFNGIRKSKETSSNANWIQTHVAQLDSMLNSWFNSVPAHLHWNSDTRPRTFTEQSAEMFAMYYNFQIFLHRPFVYTSSPLALASLAICTNAARSCIRLIETREQVMRGLMVNVIAYAAASAIIMNMWQAFSVGRPLQPRDISDVELCLRKLQQLSAKFIMGEYLLFSLKTIAKGLPVRFAELPSDVAVMTEAPTRSSMPSGYIANPDVPDIPLDFQHGSLGDMQLEFASSQWDGYPQADMSLVEDMASWLDTPSPQAPPLPLSPNAYGPYGQWAGFPTDGFFMGMDTTF